MFNRAGATDVMNSIGNCQSRLSDESFANCDLKIVLIGEGVEMRDEGIGEAVLRRSDDQRLLNSGVHDPFFSYGVSCAGSRVSVA
jgi:hypothetical protein